TQINVPRLPRYTRVEYSGVPVYRVNVAAVNSTLANGLRKLSNRFLQYDYLPLLLRAYRRHLHSHRYDLVHVEGAYPFGFFPPVNIPLNDFRAESRRALADKYGVGLDKPVVMSLSRLHPFKGLEYLVDAMPLVIEAQRKRGAALPWLLICGPSRSTENFGDY